MSYLSKYKFEESCKKFKEKKGYNTPKQLKVLEEIRKEREREAKYHPKQYKRDSDYYHDYDMQRDSDFASSYDWGSQ